MSERAMSRFKNEILSVHTKTEIKDLQRQAAGREWRLVASMIEVLVVNYAKQHGFCPKYPLP